MQPIQSINTQPSSAIYRQQAASATNVSQSSSSQSSSTVATATASNTTLTINQQVGEFLGSISPTLANNEYLKLIIAAMIMQYLLGGENATQQSGQGGINLLESLNGNGNTLQISIESSTNTVQLQNQSSRLEVTGAVQTLSETGDASAQSGERLDISG